MATLELYRSDFLFSDRNFLTGMGSVFNLGGNYYEFNVSESPEEADSRAIASDWGVVGQDLRVAIAQYKATKNGSKK